jgi:O-antigen ligase
MTACASAPAADHRRLRLWCCSPPRSAPRRSSSAGHARRRRVDLAPDLVKSNRYDYWRVAFEEFADNPIRGAGSGAFRVDWLRERTVKRPGQDAHSLYIETLGELGLVGAVILAALLVGVAVSAGRAFRRARRAGHGGDRRDGRVRGARGAGLGLEMPAVSLVALLLAGALIAWSEAAAATSPEPAG